MTTALIIIGSLILVWLYLLAWSLARISRTPAERQDPASGSESPT